MKINKIKTLSLVILLLGCIGLYAFEPSFAKDPAISPDGNQVCFVYQDDLWIVNYKGGDARRLTYTEASEWSPIWSPDGKYIAFNSNREGQTYVYVIPSSGGKARIVIRESYSIADWYADGTALLGSRFNFGFGSSMYRIPLDGSRPTLIAEIGHPFASLSPDNKKIIFNYRGDPYRTAYQGSVNGELWEIDIETGEYTR
ncbi:MAG: DPP IV N-terminal domain-containing protein, partial [Candidatus Cloacimonadaceae bacterium]|nr:DPP IV N-terminal domain-containing protein [Candidatus Cloacimonadaceae bacterium]